MSGYTLTGDLCQMSEQMDFLEKHGFNVGQIDVYPTLATKEEYDRAVLLIFEHKIDGWWNYDRDCPVIRKELLERRISARRPQDPAILPIPDHCHRAYRLLQRDEQGGLHEVGRSLEENAEAARAMEAEYAN